MNSTKRGPTPSVILIFLLVGILVGVFLGVVLVVVFSFTIKANPPGTNLVPSQPEMTAIEIGEEKTAIKIGPTEMPPTIFEQAERAIASQEPYKVKEILLPQLKSLSTWDELARAYRLLGDAEFSQGHFNLAAGYYESLYSYESNLDNLFLLATTYDQGGDLERAYQKYLLLANAGDQGFQEQRKLIDARLGDIKDVLSRRYKGILLTPEPTYTPRARP
jgi:tetratricopeptide (TPR) repeat protein